MELSKSKAPELTFLALRPIIFSARSQLLRSDLGFYLIDHRIIALAILMVLAVACEIGYRAGSRKQATSDFMNGIGAATLGLLGLLLGFTLSMAIAPGMHAAT